MLKTHECIIIFGGSVLACVRVESAYNAHMQALRDFANNPREFVNLERAAAVLSLALNRSQAYEDASYSKAVEMLDLHIVRHYNGQKSVFEENEELRAAALHLETDLRKHEAKTVDGLKDQLSVMRAQWNTTLDQLQIERNHAASLRIQLTEKINEIQKAKEFNGELAGKLNGERETVSALRREISNGHLNRANGINPQSLQGAAQFQVLTDEVERLNKSNKALLDRINSASIVWNNIKCAVSVYKAHVQAWGKSGGGIDAENAVRSGGNLLKMLDEHADKDV